MTRPSALERRYSGGNRAHAQSAAAGPTCTDSPKPGNCADGRIAANRVDSQRLMLRLILLAAAIWLAITFIRQLLQSGKTPERGTRTGEQNMVRCAQCGTHVPESEALQDGGRFFCSERHRLEARR
jgi:uncharacterized protein